MISLITTDVEHIPMCLFAICLWENVQIFSYLKKNYVFNGELYMLFVCFTYDGSKTFIIYIIYKYFLLAGSLTFYTLNSALCLPKVFFLIKSNLPICTCYYFGCNIFSFSFDSKIVLIFLLFPLWFIVGSVLVYLEMFYLLFY